MQCGPWTPLSTGAGPHSVARGPTLAPGQVHTVWPRTLLATGAGGSELLDTAVRGMNETTPGVPEHSRQHHI